jgi:branched-chain amino acid transport system permease protein
VFGIACLGLNLLFGTTGSLSLGHGTFFGIGAYTGAFLYRFWALESLELYLVSGVVASTVLAAIIGLICVHTTKIFFAILTLALSMTTYSLFVNGAVFRLFGGVGWGLYLLGGGAMFLPRLTMLGIEFGPTEFIHALYNVIVVIFVLFALLLWWIDSSPFGLALKAIRDNETRAAFIGIPVWRYRWSAFVISGLITGFAGALYGQLARQITPDQLHWLFSAQLVLATVLGGTRSFLGPVAGAFLFVGLDEVASQWSVGRNFAFGLLLVIAVHAFPLGIYGSVMAFIDRRRPKQFALIQSVAGNRMPR